MRAGRRSANGACPDLANGQSHAVRADRAHERSEIAQSPAASPWGILAMRTPTTARSTSWARARPRSRARSPAATSRTVRWRFGSHEGEHRRAGSRRLPRLDRAHGRRRMCSTVPKTVSPLCSRTVSPRMRPSSRISSRCRRLAGPGLPFSVLGATGSPRPFVG
jgi:hypothetical protein